MHLILSFWTERKSYILHYVKSPNLELKENIEIIYYNSSGNLALEKVSGKSNWQSFHLLLKVQQYSIFTILRDSSKHL